MVAPSVKIFIWIWIPLEWRQQSPSLVPLPRLQLQGNWANLFVTHPSSYPRQKVPRVSLRYSDFAVDNWHWHLLGFYWNEVVWLFSRQSWIGICPLTRSSGDSHPGNRSTAQGTLGTACRRTWNYSQGMEDVTLFSKGRWTIVWSSGSLCEALHRWPQDRQRLYLSLEHVIHHIS